MKDMTTQSKKTLLPIMSDRSIGHTLWAVGWFAVVGAVLQESLFYRLWWLVIGFCAIRMSCNELFIGKEAKQ